MDPALGENVVPTGVGEVVDGADNWMWGSTRVGDDVNVGMRVGAPKVGDSVGIEVGCDMVGANVGRGRLSAQHRTFADAVRADEQTCEVRFSSANREGILMRWPGSQPTSSDTQMRLLSRLQPVPCTTSIATSKTVQSRAPAPSQTCVASLKLRRSPP